MKYSSANFEKAVQQFKNLPGVGQKTALRFALHLLKKKDGNELTSLLQSIQDIQHHIHVCAICHNIADTPECSICSDANRKKNVLCIVETIRDVIAIENTDQYNGLYHILGGLISPLDGIGPEQLHIQSLMHRIQNGHFEEVIFVLNPTIQGDTTIFYIKKLLAQTPISLTSISRGIAFGGELEYADDFTLARALQNRLPIDNYVKN